MEQLPIPEPFRADIINQLHASHQGIVKTRRLARECVHWTHISKDIENRCQQCEKCQEPAIMHENQMLSG